MVVKLIHSKIKNIKISHLKIMKLINQHFKSNDVNLEWRGKILEAIICPKPIQSQFYAILPDFSFRKS